MCRVRVRDAERALAALGYRFEDVSRTEMGGGETRSATPHGSDAVGAATRAEPAEGCDSSPPAGSADKGGMRDEEDVL